MNIPGGTECTAVFVCSHRLSPTHAPKQGEEQESPDGFAQAQHPFSPSVLLIFFTSQGAHCTQTGRCDQGTGLYQGKWAPTEPFGGHQRLQHLPDLNDEQRERLSHSDKGVGCLAAPSGPIIQNGNFPACFV